MTCCYLQVFRNGNKSDIKRERLGPNIYSSHMAQVLEQTQTDAYIDIVA